MFPFSHSQTLFVPERIFWRKRKSLSTMTRRRRHLKHEGICQSLLMGICCSCLGRIINVPSSLSLFSSFSHRIFFLFDVGFSFKTNDVFVSSSLACSVDNSTFHFFTPSYSRVFVSSTFFLSFCLLQAQEHNCHDFPVIDFYLAKAFSLPFAPWTFFLLLFSLPSVWIKWIFKALVYFFTTVSAFLQITNCDNNSKNF